VLGFWFVLQFINSALSNSQGGGVAYAAHIGGFISGIILILFLNKKKKKKIKNKITKGPWE
jgi:membrane associated rhomboid family serine protease